MQYVGSMEIGEYHGNTAMAEAMSQLCRTPTKRQKVIVNIKFKGMVMLEAKSKVLISGLKVGGSTGEWN